ncbi:tetratricopeptide repeat protein [Bradyrhizobium sp. SRS-191]|uniref:J domain-containing protein n=1 Tax=Bradyrhizobium sp. SRS-191 TaxID=2962606 RepID=UPI00211F2CB7|nr:tetratricopeptide repeat protein [Bradyrhizobium sp. SRS-191]
MKTHYEVLGVSPRADLDTIKKAFRQAAKAHHPDLTGGRDAASEHQLKLIIIAYNVLRDPGRRAEYDEELASERARIRRERWDAIFQFTAATTVLSAILIGLEILLFPSLGDWTIRSPATRSVTLQPPAQPRSEPPRDARGDVASAPQDATGAVLPVPPPAPEASPAPSPAKEATAGQQVSPAQPTTAAGFVRRALERSQQGDLDGAIADFDEAVQLAPRNADLYRYRARDLGRRGRWDRAVADYEKAIRLDPNNPALLHDRALALQQTGELDEALVDLDRAVRMSFSDADLYSDRGAVWLAKGRYDRALADFNQALKLNPELATAVARRDDALARKREQVLVGDGRAVPAPAETTGTVPEDTKPKRTAR